MKKIVIFFLLFSFVFSFENKKIENLITQEKFNTYNKLLEKIFVKEDYSIKEILSKLKNNGLLDIFFDKAKIVHTKFIFIDNHNIFDNKLLNDSLRVLGYYYFYPSEIKKEDNKFILDIEFKSEHFIDPVFLINEMESRGCNINDVFRVDDIFNYQFDCNNPIIKEAKLLKSTNQKFINAKGVYWLKNNNFKQIAIRTKRIDYWHPSVWFYDDNLDLLNNIEINKKITNLTLDIPPNTQYIKIRDIYSGENFKRGIIVKGLK